jgi:hypothetical protein
MCRADDTWGEGDIYIYIYLCQLPSFVPVSIVIRRSSKVASHTYGGDSKNHKGLILNMAGAGKCSHTKSQGKKCVLYVLLGW